VCNRHWYEVDALMADLTSRRYRVLATSEEDAERKMRDRCPGAVAILVLVEHAALRLAAFERGWKWSQPLKFRSRPGWMWSERVNPRAHRPAEADGHHC
jgi:hypothetical protein